MTRSIAAAGACLAILAATGCATSPPAKTEVVTFEQKMAWILRLEDQRILRVPAPPVPAEAARGRRAKAAPVVLPPDLGRLLEDEEARVRRRAALAVGRVGLREGVKLLIPLLSDPELEVRQMAAFALGLIGDESAAEALEAALEDPAPLVQGRAAEALVRIGRKASAPAIAAMAARHVRDGALAAVSPDEMGHPLDPPVEAFRLGIYALAQLQAYEPLAGVVLDGASRPVSTWWPIAYALAQSGDPRALVPLLELAKSGGVEARAFAALGLGPIKDPRAVDALVSLARDWRAAPANAAIAVRSLARQEDARAVEPLFQLLKDRELDPNVRLEVVRALGALRAPQAVDLLLDLASDRWPSMRAAALGAIQQIDRNMFLLVLSGLDPDPHWSVRAAIAGMFGAFEPGIAAARLVPMLDDSDQRVVPAVLRAMAQAKVPVAGTTALKLLDADDVVVRMTAARVVGQVKPEGAREALEAAYTRWLGDTTYLARAAALAELAALDPKASVPVLRKALSDPDWAVRVRAADLLADVAPEVETASAIRPAPSRPSVDYNQPHLVSPAVTPHVYIRTAKGTIRLELFVLDAPLTADNFVALARKGFFNGVPIHRVVSGFVVQDGDPRGDGEGGPGYAIRDENNTVPYLRGTLGMALDWRDTGGSQFFITYGPQPRLDGRYTAFGRVLEGMDVLEKLQQWDTIEEVRVWDGTGMVP